MRKNQSLSARPNDQETIWGFTYLAFQILFLPGMLAVFNTKLPRALSSAELNFVFFFINFLSVVCIFHSFLGRSFQQVIRHPAYFCQAVVLGLAAYFACVYVVELLLPPGFSNANDASIAAMSKGRYVLMLLGTVVLVPPVEECLYRGLIFRNLYGKNRTAAYIVSILAFAFIHIMGYLDRYSPLELCFAVLQYLPGGLCLAWTYAKSDTIFAPIVMHAIINAVGIYRVR